MPLEYEPELTYGLINNFLERAVALDPSFAPPHAMMAWLYLSEATIGVGPPLGQMLDQALSAARTAIQLDHNSAIAHAMLAWVLDHQGNSGSALEEAETAINLNPNDPQGHLIKGHVLMLSGRPDAAREPLNTALRLDPRGPIAAVVKLKLTTCSYFERDYETADAAGRRVIRAWPNFPRPYLVYAAVLGQLGRADEARKALDAAIAASPSVLQKPYEFVARLTFVPWITSICSTACVRRDGGAMEVDFQPGEKRQLQREPRSQGSGSHPNSAVVDAGRR